MYAKPEIVFSILMTQGFRVGSDFRPYLSTIGLFDKIIGDVTSCLLLHSSKYLLKLFHYMIIQNDNSLIKLLELSENMDTPVGHMVQAVNCLQFVFESNYHC